MRHRGKRKGRKTETWLILPFKCRVMVTEWTVLSAMMHQWGTNERDSVMVRYVTLCENSVKLWEKRGANVSPLPIIPRQQQVQIPGSSLNRSEPCGRSSPNRLKRSWMCSFFRARRHRISFLFFFLFFSQRSMLEGVEVGEGVPLAVPPQPCPFT